MSPNRPFAVCYAGVPGTSKSPISNFLSWNFGLGILNQDQIRFEVKEDLMVDSILIPEAHALFEKKLKERSEEIFGRGQSIIIDGSVDRRWPERKEQFRKHGYAWFLIDMNLSFAFLEKLFNATKRGAFVNGRLPNYMKQHDDFRAKHSADISLTITDDTFRERVTIAAAGLQEFIDKLK